MNSELDRTRRVSRESPLPAGSHSELLPPFGRGSYRGSRGRGMVRGRGGGGYYDSDSQYGRSQSVQSRSPEPQQIRPRRTQQSDNTPPPQVPAFGSTSAPTPTGPGSLPPSVPTAPRSYNSKAVPSIGRSTVNIAPYKFPPPTDKDSSQSHPQDTKLESPRSVGKVPPTGPSEYRTPIHEAISPKGSISFRDDVSVGEIASPRESIPNIQKPTDKSVSPFRANDEGKDVHISSAKSPEQESSPPDAPKEPRLRHAVAAKRRAKSSSSASFSADESSTDEDELDDNYFEEKSSNIRNQISQIRGHDPLKPSFKLKAKSLVQPFMASIDDIIASYPHVAEPCVAPIVETQVSFPAPLAITSAPAIKQKSPSTTSVTETKPTSILRVNDQDPLSNLDAHAASNVNGSVGNLSARPIPSIAVPPYSGPQADAAQGQVSSVGRLSPLPRIISNTKNGTHVKPRPTMEHFEIEDEYTASEKLDTMRFVQSRSQSPSKNEKAPLMAVPANKPILAEQSNGKAGHEELQDHRFPRPLAVVSDNRQNVIVDRVAETEDERRVRVKEEENDAIRLQAIRSVKPVPSGRAAMYKGGLDQISSENNSIFTQQDLLAVRKMMKTPPVSTLPRSATGSCWDDNSFLCSLELQDPVVAAELGHRIREREAKRAQEQQEASRQREQRYRDYRKYTDQSMSASAKNSRKTFADSRAKAAAESAAPLISMTSTSSKPEGRRSRWATDRDLERVLRESESEARKQDEQDEKNARRKSAKEAIIPNMCWSDEFWEANDDVMVDKTHAVSFERSFSVLEYGQPISNFSEEESATFERVYVEHPKQFDKIAAALPNRDFKACIQHYYLVKHEMKLKEKAKEKEKAGKKKGRKAKNTGRPKANALTASVNVDDAEEGQEENSGDRRRPRRAAAPVFPIDAPPSENDVASPAPTPGRKATALPKSDNGNETGPRKKAKIAPQKTAKQAKSSQPLAAAPTAGIGRQVESPIPNPVSATRKATPGASHFPSQMDGGSQAPPMTSFNPFGTAENRQAAMAPSYEIPPQPQPYPSQERPDTATSVSIDQDRRNLQQTSSYWSVPETQEFPTLLAHFGTNWQDIAKYMTSKTHIMVYKYIFQDWLSLPADTNKSRFVANILAQVKNYYQRSVDSGKMRQWKVIAEDADGKRARGEPTDPLPPATVIAKKRFEPPTGSVPRAGSAMEGLEGMSSPGPNVTMVQASPSSQPSLISRYPSLAQASSVPHIQPATPASVMSKPMPQTQQQPPQQQGRRGPQLGYFNTDSPRPILQAQSSDPEIAQRSRLVAQEAQLERQSALRIEQEQREAQQQLERQRELQQSQQQASRDAINHHRQLQLKQESEATPLHQFEAYSAPSMHSNIVPAHSRSELPQSAPLSEHRRNTVPPQQYQPRPSHPAVRSILSDSPGGPREMKPSPSPLNGPGNAPPLPRAPLSAPPVHKEQYPVPPQSKPQVPQVAAVRQQETVRKTSNIMSLLNDEPSEPRPEPPKRVPNPNAIPTPQAVSRTPPPQAQHPLQANRFASHQPPMGQSSHQHQMSQQSTAHLNSPPSHFATHGQLQRSRHNSFDGRFSGGTGSAGSTTPSHQGYQPSHPPSIQYAQQPTQQHPSQSQHQYSQSTQHTLHQHSSSIGHPRSYTPTSFEGRGYGSGQPLPQQSMYPQSNRQPMAPQASSIRRESSLGESPHGISGGGYSRTGPSQSSMRLKESPYSSTPPPAPQGSRHQIGSPLDLAPPSDRDYYPRQPQYLMQQQQSAVGSPQLGPTFHPPPQQPNHRQIAFGNSQPQHDQYEYERELRERERRSMEENAQYRRQQ